MGKLFYVGMGGYTKTDRAAQGGGCENKSSDWTGFRPGNEGDEANWNDWVVFHDNNNMTIAATILSNRPSGNYSEACIATALVYSALVQAAVPMQIIALRRYLSLRSPPDRRLSSCFFLLVCYLFPLVLVWFLWPRCVSLEASVKIR